MTISYSLFMIKPLSIGRGDGPAILKDILKDCPVSLRFFRNWSICDTTLFALSQSKGLSEGQLRYEDEVIHSQRQGLSWICLFTHKDRVTDPTDILNAYCGPENYREWLPHHLRYRYGGFAKIGKTAHASDTVVYIAKADRTEYESNLLFLDFDPSQI